MKSLIEDIFKRSEKGESFFIGICRYYLDGEEYYASGLTIGPDIYEDLELDDSSFTATFYFPKATTTRVDYKDIQSIVANTNDYLYYNREVVSNFIDELENHPKHQEEEKLSSLAFDVDLTTKNQEEFAEILKKVQEQNPESFAEAIKLVAKFSSSQSQKD